MQRLSENIQAGEGVLQIMAKEAKTVWTELERIYAAARLPVAPAAGAGVGVGVVAPAAEFHPSVSTALKMLEYESEHAVKLVIRRLIELWDVMRQLKQAHAAYYTDMRLRLVDSMVGYELTRQVLLVVFNMFARSAAAELHEHRAETRRLRTGGGSDKRRDAID